MEVLEQIEFPLQRRNGPRRLPDHHPVPVKFGENYLVAVTARQASADLDRPPVPETIGKPVVR